MPLIAESKVSLGIFGAELDPKEITRLLNRQPSRSRLRGEKGLSDHNGKPVPPVGSWHLYAEDRTPGDVDGQIRELLSELPEEPSVWSAIASYKTIVHVGLFMSDANEGFELEAETLKLLAKRGLRIVFEIYDQSG